VRVRRRLMPGIFRKLCVAAMVDLLAGTAHADEQVLRYQPAVVHLTGTVRMEQHYGPPNFAPGSRIETVPVLVLMRPVTVRGNPGSPADGDSYQNVTRIQLVLAEPGGNNALSAYAGTRVQATGRLFEKVSGENFTDVLLDVQQIGLASGGP